MSDQTTLPRRVPQRLLRDALVLRGMLADLRRGLKSLQNGTKGEGDGDG